MNQEELLLRIRQYLARLSAEVQIANANNEQSVNIHIENILIPILDLLFECELFNANYHKEKNYFSVDLFDKSGKCAIQVTSTNSSTKIIDTLKKYSNGKLDKIYKKIYVILIGKHKLNYNKSTIDKIGIITKGDFIFDISEQVIDFGDIYRIINKNNNFLQIKSIHDILDSQFSQLTTSLNYDLELSNFIAKYKKAIFASSFKRISFLGLSTSRRPREIDIYSLFIFPKFKYSTLEKFHKTIHTKDLSIQYADLAGQIKNFKSSINMSVTDISNIDIEVITRGINWQNDLFEKEINLNELLKGLKRGVVLGKPGAGKSSFIKFAMCKILEGDEEVFADKNTLQLIPFRIELSEYYKFRKSVGEGFIKYIVRTLSNSYHIENFSEELLKHILKSKKVLVFFDGLDEIFDLSERLAIRDEVKFFADTYSNCKVLVTSRYESNQEVPFGKDYNHYEVLGFDDDQIGEYIEKWYCLEEPDDDIRHDEIVGCKRELEKVSDELKRNPLLLSLIVILYRNDLVLPTSKLEIYESCTNTLIETRDSREKKLEITHKVSNTIATFSDLAYWQFNSFADKNTNSLTYDTVLNHVKDYLITKGECEDELQAFNVANYFLDFAKVRSIYFENNFTHKTFLEYFTANYIFSSYYVKASNKVSFYQIVKNKFSDASWAIVIELLLSKIDRVQNDFEELDIILNNIYITNSYKAITFILKALIYLKNISPSALRFYIDVAIRLCIKNYRTSKNHYETKTIFSYLLILINSPRFHGTCQSVFDSIGQELTITPQFLNYKIFFLEHLYSNTNNKLSFDIISYSKSNDPYEFILSNLIELQNEGSQIDLLKEFFGSYGKKAVIISYSTSYADGIFNGESSFNWISLIMFGHCDINKIASNYKILKQLGFSQKEVIKSLSTYKSKPKFTKSEISKAISISKDKALISILKNYRDNYKLRAYYNHILL